jgi:hypothetical protein
MASMKKLLSPLAVALLCISTIASAAPVASSNLGREYLIGSSGLENWSAGIYGGTFQREITFNGFDTELESNRGYFYLGYDVMRWMTPYAALGVSDSKIGGVSGESAEFAYELGVHFNLIDHEMMDSTLMEDRVRVNANVSYGATEASDVRWSELTASLTAGLVNDLDGNKTFVPESIGLYLGPVFSYIRSDEIEANNEVGLLVGLDFYVTPRVVLDINAIIIDDTSVFGGLHFRF